MIKVKNKKKDEIVEEVINEEVEEIIEEIVEEVVEPVVETEVVEESVVETEVVEEPAEPEVETSEETVEALPIGVVTAAKLNVRKEANAEAEVACVITKGNEVTIDFEKSTEEFYKVYGVCKEVLFEGYCMKQFISIK